MAILTFVSEMVETQVLEVLSHVNKRVKPRQDIALPVLELVDAIVEPTASTLYKNFLVRRPWNYNPTVCAHSSVQMIYIKMGFDRAKDPMIQQRVVFSLLANLHRLNASQQLAALGLFLGVLPHRTLT